MKPLQRPFYYSHKKDQQVNESTTETILLLS